MGYIQNPFSTFFIYDIIFLQVQISPDFSSCFMCRHIPRRNIICISLLVFCLQITEEIKWHLTADNPAIFLAKHDMLTLALFLNLFLVILG